MNHLPVGITPEGEDKRLGLNLCYRTLTSILKYDKQIPSNRNDTADQPGVFIPPTMLVLSSQAGGFRERVAGPRDCYADGPCCSESAIVR